MKVLCGVQVMLNKKEIKNYLKDQKFKNSSKMTLNYQFFIYTSIILNINIYKISLISSNSKFLNFMSY